MTTISFVRHGRTHWNHTGRAQGSADIPLDEEGIRTAERLRERIQAEMFDAVYASDLIRAYQTAEIAIGPNHEHVIQTDERLREVNGGDIEGTTEQERVERWGEDWRALDLGRETKEAAVTRGKAAIEDIVNKHPNERILIVSHGTLIRLVVDAIATIDDPISLDNTSVTTVQFMDEKWECELYNCTKHLS